jgi:hypothetical protein
MMNYVGIDHHRQYSHMTLMDQEGQVLRSGWVPNLRAEIEKFLEGARKVDQEATSLLAVLEQKPPSLAFNKKIWSWLGAKFRESRGGK